MATDKRKNNSSNDGGSWDFLTNHSHILLCVAEDPGSRLRDIAEQVGITERATHRILTELIDAGYVDREKDGRRNQYTVKLGQPLRHPLVESQTVGELIKALRPVKQA